MKKFTQGEKIQVTDGGLLAYERKRNIKPSKKYGFVFKMGKGEI